ncbi:HNH endonuclease [Pseudomonas aeruginosa]|uniref:HNH endonuclease n=1 Tax=Pseudomonas aeruginosa TaxID=287 RepID=UPI0009A25BB8|nr:HNH endonuclease signature motif containing protein [Pseudomonas aeruginosa]WCV81932.1 HNH endonuclease [Pseudomonas aeruginosa]HBO0862562.1 HNH endonuclease [Pseudomonas aeruginosa]HBO1242253.1 HNH endonuclease [Pseudomonas aeruginosa]HBO2084054.1 HNH endonuclease [Pseudomonas aeruginosa]HBO5216134.1 HNH endonuclease [Pseudomonas aeruginosa]
MAQGRAVQTINPDSWRSGKNSTQRGYGYRWQQARARYLAKHPLCRLCSDAGKVVEATEVDHIIPHRGDTELFWQESNWMALCKVCHSKKTATEDGGFGNSMR